MNHVIVIQFITLDGVVEDPDGSAGRPFGGWAFRYGPEAVAGDKFGLGPRLDTGALLFGRRTWELFSGIWPKRTDTFSTQMNTAPKLVASQSLTDLSAWSNSAAIEGELASAVDVQRHDRDIIVIGSTSVVRYLMERDLVDEYRLLVFPAVLGTGQRLFETPAGADALRLTSVEQSGAAALLCFARADKS